MIEKMQFEEDPVLPRDSSEVGNEAVLCQTCTRLTWRTIRSLDLVALRQHPVRLQLPGCRFIPFTFSGVNAETIPHFRTPLVSCRHT